MWEKRVDEKIKEMIDSLDNTFIDYSLREGLGMGYALDTNLYLYAAKQPERHRKLRDWIATNQITVYSTVFKEIAKKIVDEEIKNLWEENNRIEQTKLEKDVIFLLNRQKTRLVLNKEDDDTEKIKDLNPELYEKLKSYFKRSIHFISYSRGFSFQVRSVLNKEKTIDSFVDLCLIMYSSFENIPIITFDQGINTLLFRHNLPRVDIFNFKLPHGKSFNWAEIISNQENSQSSEKIISP